MDRFIEDGYAIFPSPFEGAEIGALRGEVARFCQSVTPGDPAWRRVVGISALRPHRNPGISLPPGEDVPFIVSDLPAVSPAFWRLLAAEPLWAVARAVLGSAGEIVYHFANITRKPARIGPNMSWHRDFPNGYICPASSRHFFRCLIPLETMDAENGGTAVLPGTHLISDSLAIEEENRRDFDLSTAVVPALAAGEALAIDSKIVHGGTANRSGRDRNLLVIQFGLRTGDFRAWDEETFSGWTREQIRGSGNAAG